MSAQENNYILCIVVLFVIYLIWINNKSTTGTTMDEKFLQYPENTSGFYTLPMPKLSKDWDYYIANEVLPRELSDAALKARYENTKKKINATKNIWW